MMILRGGVDEGGTDKGSDKGKVVLRQDRVWKFGFLVPAGGPEVMSLMVRSRQVDQKCCL